MDFPRTHHQEQIAIFYLSSSSQKTPFPAVFLLHLCETSSSVKKFFLSALLQHFFSEKHTFSPDGSHWLNNLAWQLEIGNFKCFDFSPAVRQVFAYDVAEYESSSPEAGFCWYKLCKYRIKRHVLVGRIYVPQLED